MTTLIKSAAGKLLKAEGKIWDQNSVTDCDCPCYSDVECDDSPEIERINIKCSGKWGIEWTVSHPGGTYDLGEVDLTAPAFNESGSFLLDIPPLVKSWKHASPINDNRIIDNWAGLQNSITYDNCAGPSSLFYVFESWSRFGVSASFPTPPYSSNRVTLTDVHECFTPRYTNPITLVIFTNGGVTKVTDDCGFPCCSSLTTGDDWAPSSCGAIGLGIIPSVTTEFYNDYEFEYTEHTPTFTQELKGTV